VDPDRVLEALAAESRRLAGIMLAVGEDDFDRPTRCRPWTVRALLAHVLVASNRLPAMLAEATLAEPQPEEASVSAASYYRADERFGREATDARIAAATSDAASFVSGHALAQVFEAAVREMLTLSRAEPPGRVVFTRWRDAMLLSDFLATRVVELAIHGLDLADGLGRDPWMTPPAADVVHRVLDGRGAIASVPELDWDQATLIEVATGRRPVTEAESDLLVRHGVKWPTFG